MKKGTDNVGNENCSRRAILFSLSKDICKTAIQISFSLKTNSDKLQKDMEKVLLTPMQKSVHGSIP